MQRLAVNNSAGMAEAWVEDASRSAALAARGEEAAPSREFYELRDCINWICQRALISNLILTNMVIRFNCADGCTSFSLMCIEFQQTICIDYVKYMIK